MSNTNGEHMKLDTKQMRQGDVLLVATETIIEGEPEKQAEGELVLAHGEVTGHRHRFMERGEITSSKAGRQLLLQDTARLFHEEHADFSVLAGRYDLPRQCEWDDSMEPRQVAD